MKRLLLALAASLLICINVSAQVKITSNPSPSLTARGMFGVLEKIAETVLPALQEFKMPNTDSNLYNIPTDSRPVDISFMSKATAEILGDHVIYRQKITGLDATSVKISFDHLILSKNAELYIYTPSGSVITGPITYLENIGKDRIWGSNRFPGSEAIIELKVPANEVPENEIHLSKISLGINMKKFSDPNNPASFGWYGNADACVDKNVLCSYGNDWVNERKAICLIEFEEGSNTYFASGALVANTCNSNKPYLLTAYHNIDNHNPNNWQFYFGWWSPTCTNFYTQTALLFNGAYTRASYFPTDFALLELANTPSSGLDITYLGWSRSSNPPTSSVGIHHPGGDQMKIAFSSSAATADNIPRPLGGSAWKLLWSFGGTQPGSSGSPLFDPNKKVVGQLWGGTTGGPCDARYAYYGRFDLSWVGGGTDETGLRHWLDPTGINATETNTTYVSNLTAIYPSTYIIDGPSQFCTSQNYSISALPAQGTVSWSVEGTYLSYSQSNNILTINRGSRDEYATIRATINICGETYYKQKTVRVGGAPITIESTQLACDQFQFDVSGAASIATYTWTSNYNTIIYDFTSTTLTTPYTTVSATTTGGDDAIVTTTNTCFQTVEAYVQMQNIYLRNIDGIMGIYSNGDQVVCSVNTTPYDTYYKWYINGYLDSEGETLSGFATYNYPPQGQGIVCGDNTIRVEVYACGGMVSSDEYHFWKMGNCFGRSNGTSNVELFPNPAFNQTTIRLHEVKDSPVKLKAIKNIRITDKMGNFITEIKYAKNSASVNIDLSRLSAGMYYIEVSDGVNKTVLPMSILK